MRNSLLFFGGTCALYVFLALMVTFEDRSAVQPLIAEGRVTTGTVTGTDCGNHGSVLRAFTPSASDPRLSEYGTIGEPRCDLVRPGQRIVIVYLPANPALNRIRDPRDQLASNVQFLDTALVFMPGFGLSWVALALYLYARGSPAYRDPVVPTIGRAPEAEATLPLTVGASRVTSRTEELPMPPEVRLVLTNEAAELATSSLRLLAVFAAALAAVGIGGAIGAQHLLPLITFGGGAVALTIGGWLVRRGSLRNARRDATFDSFTRTSGAVRLTWVDSRGGRVWTLRVGDRELGPLDDEIGLQLGNMPWGVADYTTTSRKLLTLRDLDGRYVYRRQASHQPKHGALFAVAVFVLALVILGLAIGSALVMSGARVG